MTKGIKILFPVLLLAGNSLYAQLVNNGSVITVGNGVTLFIEGDWTNNSTNTVFDAGSLGNVNFSGANQSINGNETAFPGLILSGTGSKTLNTNASVSGVLDLDGRELKLNDNRLTVLNTSSNAVIFTTGYISTDAGGEFLRATNSTGSYFFPMGSALGSSRIRPVVVTPKDNQNNTYGVSFRNKDASSDGLSTDQRRAEITNVNTAYYHVLKASGVSGADFSLLYSSAQDGGFNQLVNWAKVSVGWEKAGISNPQTITSTIPGLNSSLTFSSAQPFSDIPVAFASTPANNDPLTFFNSFTPNGDGKNDRWEIKNIDVFPDNELTILNRWGGEVFKAKPYNSSNAWDGSDLNSGTYYYLLKVNVNGEPKVYKGFITLLKNE